MFKLSRLQSQHATFLLSTECFLILPQKARILPESFIFNASRASVHIHPQAQDTVKNRLFSKFLCQFCASLTRRLGRRSSQPFALEESFPRQSVSPSSGRILHRQVFSLPQQHPPRILRQSHVGETQFGRVLGAVFRVDDELVHPGQKLPQDVKERRLGTDVGLHRGDVRRQPFQMRRGPRTFRRRPRHHP